MQTPPRPHHLVAAAFAGALAVVARGYYPTLPIPAYGLTALLVAAALVHVSLAWSPAPPPGNRLPWSRRLLLAPAALLYAAALGFMVFHGAVLWFIVERASFYVAVGLELAAVLVALVFLRGRLSYRARWLFVVTLIFVDAIAFIPVCMHIWQRPDPAACAAADGHPAVSRLTPASLPAGYSFPYEILWLPESKRLVGSFKMAGNLTIRPWDRPWANRLVVVDTTALDAPVVADLQLEGEPLPQYMGHHQGRDEIVVNRLGFWRQLYDFVDLSGFPELRLVRRVELPVQPHGMHLVDGGTRIAQVTMFRELALFDYDSVEELSRVVIPTLFWDPGFTVLDVARDADDDTLYAAMLGSGIVRLDWRRGASGVRVRTVGFGGGEITVDPEAPMLWLTEFFGGSLREVDARTLEIRREVDLGYKPRPVAVDAPGDRVFVGNWFDGEVNIYRRSSLERIAGPLPIGPYMRDLAWDAEREVLFAASKCGLWAIDVNAALNTR